ncbi:MAG: leucine-rich repeat domain-containing protein [Oscillospiraceae bacterium]|nr:leucine-rich repeat domain-containing protein [Oscillospiraceae bacterium]
MKRHLLGFVLACALMLCAAPAAFAADGGAELMDSDWTWEVKDGILWMTKYNGSASEVTIPDSAMINGQSYPLKVIGASAFANNTSVTSVIVPSRVIRINEKAFMGCTRLASVSLPNSLLTLGASVFSGCTALTDITIPSEVSSVGESAFLNCTALSTATINGSASLGSCAFKNCTALRQLTINGNLADCNSNSIASSYTQNYSVFYNAGANADALSVTFGPSVTRVPAYLFGTYTTVNYAHVTSVSFPDSLREIGAGAFAHCDGLTKLTCNAGLAYIGVNAFSWCYNLKSISLPATLSTVGSYAFSYTTALTGIKLPSSMVSLGEGAFKGSGITSATINGSSLSVGADAFLDCASLSTVTINGTSSLGDCAFKNCSSLSRLTINSNLADCNRSSASSSSSYSVFYNAGSNSGSIAVTFGSSVTRVPAYLFCTYPGKSANVYAHVMSVSLPGNIRTIGAHAFDSCYDLAEIALPASMTAVGDGAFAYCTALTTATINGSNLTVGSSAFANCISLREVTISGVQSLGNSAFQNCTMLSSLVINSNLSNCSSNSASNSSSYSVFYNTGSNADAFVVTFGTSVTTVPSYLFATSESRENDKHAHITSVYFSDNLTQIGTAAFYNCYELKDVFYGGNETNWNTGVSIASSNDYLTRNQPVCDYVLPVPGPRTMEIKSITVRNSKGKSVSTIPTGSFTATVTVRNISSDGDAAVLLAAYTSSGRMRSVIYVSIRNFPTGAEFDLTIPVNNDAGDIVKLKAFTVNSVKSMQAISSPVTFE